MRTSQLNQEVFDTVSKHLLKQGVPSVDSDGACRYRGLNGRSCAVGCLIDDEYYTSKMEAWGVFRPHVQGIVAKSLGVPELEESTIHLLSALQRLHDRVKPSAWKEKLVFLAKEEGLEFNHDG